MRLCYNAFLILNWRSFYRKLLFGALLGVFFITEVSASELKPCTQIDALIGNLENFNHEGYTGKWAGSKEGPTTLNFSFIQKDDAVDMKTGREGNVYLIRKSGRKDPYPEDERFDVDTVHQYLAYDEIKARESVGGDNNFISVGVSLFFWARGRYEVVFIPFFDKKKISQKTKKKKKNKKIIKKIIKQKAKLIFVSGYSKKKSDQSNDNYTFINACNKEEELKKAFDERAARNFQLKIFDRQWGEKKECLGAVNSLIVDVEQLFSDKPLQGEGDREKDYSSKFDSEQVFLHYLANHRVEHQKYFIRAVSNLFQIYNEETKNQLERAQYFFEKTLSMVKNNPTENTNVKNRCEKITKDFRGILEPYKRPIKFIGCIFHLHSTRELCQSCCISIAHDFFRKRKFDDLLNVFREKVKSPFLSVFASAEKKMDVSCKTPPIPENVTFKLENGLLSMNFLLAQHSFAQAIIVPYIVPACYQSAQIGIMNCVKGAAREGVRMKIKEEVNDENKQENQTLNAGDEVMVDYFSWLKETTNKIFNVIKEYAWGQNPAFSDRFDAKQG